MMQVINLSEKIKQVLKFVGIVLLVFFLYGLFSLFTGNEKKEAPNRGLSSFIQEGDQYPQDELLQKEFAPAMEMEETKFVDSSGTSPVAPTSAEGVFDRKVIKNGNLSLKVEDVNEAAGKIGSIAKSMGGEIFSTNFYERVKGQRSGYLTVKVPVSKFESAVEKIKEVATQVVSESTTGRDVTEQYSDLQAQLKNKRAEEQSFVGILDRAGEIQDVLATTREISRVRGEIERLEGRIRMMDSQTEMSTIMVNLTEDVDVSPISKDWRIGQVFKEALDDLKEAFQGFVNGVIRFVVLGIPSLIPFLIFVIFVFWAGKKIKKKMNL